MDRAERSRLRELAEYMAASRGLYASRDVAEILRAIDALDAAEAERDAARADVARLRESLDGLNAELRDLLLLPPDEDGVLMPMPIARGLARMAGHITAALAAADMASDVTEPRE